MVRGNGVGRRYVWTTGQGWQKDSQNEEGTTYDGQYCSGAEGSTSFKRTTQAVPNAANMIEKQSSSRREPA